MKLNGQYVGRIWRPVVESEQDVLREIQEAGYDPDIVVSLGDIDPVVPEAVREAMASL